MAENPVTGVNVTQADLLLIIGDQTVTIAVLRQQLGEARAEIATAKAQTEGLIQTFKAELEAGKRAQTPKIDPTSPFAQTGPVTGQFVNCTNDGN